MAASAAGVADVRELADLVVDSGAVALPPADGITDTYTLEDLGKRLWGLAQNTPQTKRATWFARLVETQQKALIVILRDRGYATMVIAQDFGISPSEVTRVWNAHASDLGSQVIALRLDTIAGAVQMAAERAMTMAIENDDHAAYWRINREMVKVWQDLGILDRAAHRVEVTHHSSHEKQDAIRQLIDLEKKQLAREEEIKQIDAVEVESDTLPEHVDREYEEMKGD